MRTGLAIAIATATLVAAGAASADPSATPPSDAATNSSAANSAASSTGPAVLVNGHPVPTPQMIVDVPPPPEGKGEVVFFRRWAFQGAAVWFRVREQGDELGKLSDGVYLVAIEDPGVHTFTAATENKDHLRLQIDPGETYYVEGRVSMGLVIGEANLSPSDEATFESVAKRLKLVGASAPQKSAGAQQP